MSEHWYPTPDAQCWRDGKNRRRESYGRHAMSLNHFIEAPHPEVVQSQLTLFAEAFPVSPTPWLADVADRPTTATSGPTRSELFAQFNPDGSCSKMYPDCSPLMLDGSSEEFYGTWPRAGLMLSGTIFQRPPLAPLTDVIASGSWPTPRDDPKHARYWPTPQASDWKTAHEYLPGERDHSPQLRHVLTGQLNPTWVEWLMGFPRGWTDCGPSGTASSRKSRKSSGGRS